ncbi:Tetrapyrrole methylase [Amanita muscaria]
MFYLIGLGLCDESDITLRGLTAIQRCSRVYLEAYTSILMVPQSRLESFYKKPLILADREMVESSADEILKDADKEDVALLVVGDPFGATTHTDIILRARSLRIPTQTIHNASILTSIGSSGLQLYNFGQTVSLVFFTPTWRPTSFYDRISENANLGLHTLVLLDIKVKEQSEENLARGRKVYEKPRYMSIPQALEQMREVEEEKKEGTLDVHNTLVIALSRMEPSAFESERIVAGTIHDLLSVPESEHEQTFGSPLHSLIIVGKRLHVLEAEFAEAFAVNKENWRKVAREVYMCALG